MILAVQDPRFKIQKIPPREWARATAANAAADHLAGFSCVTGPFLASRAEPEFAALRELLESGGSGDIVNFVEKHRGHSLGFLVLMLTGACNADCEICFTDRKRKAGELTPNERDRVLRQAKQLGARFVYVPGEGEPTIDKGFWQFLATCRELDLEAVVFTNGIVFSDAPTCRKYWGCEPREGVARLADYPVSFYHKFWSTKPDLVAEMMRIPRELCRSVSFEGTLVPLGLIRLLEGLPLSRVGIEVVVERRNAREVVGQIVPFAETHGLARIVEMIQHNGRVLGRGEFDPDLETAAAVAPLLSPTSCTMATCKAVVTTRGYLSPRIAVLENQIPGEPVDVRRGDLFDLLHETSYIVRRRYDIHTCLCEKLPMQAACCQGESSVTMSAPNVAPQDLVSGRPCPGGNEG